MEKIADVPNELVTQYLIPTRIVWQKNAQNAEVLLTEQARQAFLGNLPVCTLKRGGYVLLDFGLEFQGGADIVVQWVENGMAELRIVFGESVTEALSMIGEKNATNDHSLRDMTVSVGSLSRVSLGNTGYRFLKLEAAAGEISIASVQGISRFRDLEYRGAFRCSDIRLNEIWSVGARTVHLNMQEYLWDGIKRDRLVWVGDMHPETAAISMVFGETDVVKKSLDFVRDNTPADSFMNGFISYSMWWIKIQRDLYWDSGNFTYLKQQEDALVSILEHTLSTIDNTGYCNVEEKFVEWSTKNTPDEEAACYAMLVAGLTAGVELLEFLRVSTPLAARCKLAVARIKGRKFALFGNKQAAAMMGLNGLKDLKQVCADVIKPGGAEGISAFGGYYVLLALSKAGEMQAALDVVRTYWGKMIDLGATTFWEDFDIRWAENACRIDEMPQTGKADVHGDFGKFCYRQFRHSLCHGWASGPTAFMSRHILGVYPVIPGYRKVRLHPNLGALSFAEGKIPTPLGVIDVRHDTQAGDVKTTISVPEGIEIV